MRKNSLATKLLSVTLGVLLLAGCQGNAASTASTSTAGAASQAVSSEAEAPKSDFPKNSLTMITPVSPGGSSDTVSRAMAKYSEKYLGQPMVVTNMAGGASTLGTAECINSKPDGYTMVYSPVGAICVQPHYGQIDYTYSDVTAIAQISEEDCVLVVPKDTFTTLEELIEYGKENPGSIKYGNSSQGGPVHMVMAKLFNDAEVEAEAIGYKGSSDVKAALMGGHITASIMHPSEVAPIIDSGDVVALAISTSTGERNPDLADIPSFTGLGYDITFTVWKGVFAPKDLPADVQQALEDTFESICTDPDFIAEMDQLKQSVNYMNSEDFTAKVKDNFEYYGKVIEEVNMIELMNS